MFAWHDSCEPMERATTASPACLSLLCRCRGGSFCTVVNYICKHCNDMSHTNITEVMVIFEILPILAKIWLLCQRPLGLCSQENDFWISRGKVATVYGLQVRRANVQAIGVKFSQDLRHQKSPKSVHFIRKMKRWTFLAHSISHKHVIWFRRPI